MPSDLPLSPESAASDPQQSRLFQCAEVLRSLLRVLIEPTQLAARTPFMKSLAPTAADYARVFVPAAVAKAQSYYEAMWRQPAQMVWDPYHTVLRLHVALPEDFLSAHPRARGFPPGYFGIAGMLVPGIPWARIELLQAGHSYGISTDGLVWLEERLLWFPRPYIALIQDTEQT